MKGERESADADASPAYGRQGIIDEILERKQQRDYSRRAQTRTIRFGHHSQTLEWRSRQDLSSALFPTLSEGLWCLDLGESLPVDGTTRDQIRGVLDTGRIFQCNETMAGMLGARSVDDVIGTPVREHALFCGLVRTLVQSAYDVPRAEATVLEDGRRRHFLLRAAGIRAGGALVRIRGCCIEITDEVDAERRMASALENQFRDIAREIHDGLGQVLTAAGLLSQCLELDLAGEEGRATERARRLVRLTGSAQQMLRSVYGRLVRPALPQGKPILEALRDLCIDTDRSADPNCAFVCEPDVELPASAVNHHLFRIAREAVDNAVKHSGARHIVMSVHRGNQAELVVEISDDGAGFDEKSVCRASLGMTGMYYWARMIGARFEIASTPGGGTTITCRVPVGPTYDGAGVDGSSGAAPRWAGDGAWDGTRTSIAVDQ